MEMFSRLLFSFPGADFGILATLEVNLSLENQSNIAGDSFLFVKWAFQQNSSAPDKAAIIEHAIYEYFIPFFLYSTVDLLKFNSLICFVEIDSRKKKTSFEFQEKLERNFLNSKI